MSSSNGLAESNYSSDRQQVYVFAAANDEGDDRLWIAGPGLSNPRLLVDIDPGATGNNAFDFAQLADGRVLFLADDGLRGRELWVTDGTDGGTHLVRDVRPGIASSLPDIVGVFGNQALFTVDVAHSTRELWVTDGTVVGTKMLVSPEFGKPIASLSDFNQMANGQWLFVAKDMDDHQDVWVTDGTAAGTHILADLPVMNASKLRDIMLSPDGRDAYIRDDHLMWRTDGTAEGTVLLGRGSVPLDDGKWMYLKNLNGSKYATFHITDGTEEGTHPLFQSAGSYDVISFGDGRSLIYAGASLYVTDGTTEGTQRFFSGVSYYPSLHLTDFMSLDDGRILFTEMKGGLGTWNSAEVWVTDGTADGTYQLGAPSPDMPKSLPDHESWLRLDDGSIVFSAPSFNDPTAVWKVDLTAGSIKQVEGVSFSAGTTFHGIQLPAVPENGNHPASGSLVISGTDLVAGDFVSVNGVNIQDPDGWLIRPLLYRWYRDNADGGWDEIPGNPPAGTPSSQLFLTDADVGHRLKVSTHFLDDKGHLETITSAPSGVVRLPGAPAGSSEPHQWSEKLPLFDITYYLANNPDVAQSGMDPLQHFLQFGGLEGRSPNADFDSAFYLSHYPEVAKAGINPFLHYLAYGWQEGRMASAKNDFQALHPEIGSPELTQLARELISYPAEPVQVDTPSGLPAAALPQMSSAEAPSDDSAPSNVAHPAASTPENGRPADSHEGHPSVSLFDTSYYLGHNPDVAASGMSPLQHFLQFGGQEGRSPNADFDSAFYLSHNPDVAAAGLNPFLHYLAYGWREGRDASAIQHSADFATAHPDVTRISSIAEAKVYLQDGASPTGTVDPEPAAVTQPSVHASHSLVDSQFYYDTYKDVAQAGVDAYEHYMTFGWREGRDPDALFDTRYYLDHNADVMAAGVNPLEHYLQFGAREGRDPSARFDTDAYLQHNPDVAAVGTNPLLHYLQHGVSEGRDIFHA